MIYNFFFQNLLVGHDRFSFYGLQKSEEGADTDLILVKDVCWPVCSVHYCISSLLVGYLHSSFLEFNIYDHLFTDI